MMKKNIAYGLPGFFICKNAQPEKINWKISHNNIDTILAIFSSDMTKKQLRILL